MLILQSLGLLLAACKFLTSVPNQGSRHLINGHKVYGIIDGVLLEFSIVYCDRFFILGSYSGCVRGRLSVESLTLVTFVSGHYVVLLTPLLDV